MAIWIVACLLAATSTYKWIHTIFVFEFGLSHWGLSSLARNVLRGPATREAHNDLISEYLEMSNIKAVLDKTKWEKHIDVIDSS